MTANGPLLGLRVLDACDGLAVYGTKLLIQLGADVVRPEPPDGDPMRRFPPYVGEQSLYFEHFNAGKRSVTLDPTTDPGRLERLVASCHAIVESGDGAALLSSRIGIDRLCRWRPDLVLVSVTPFGSSGPRSAWLGNDLVVAAESGLLALNGRPDAPPYRPGGEQASHMAGLVAANAALLGLLDQQRTGRGCRIDVPAAHAATLTTLQTANANYYTWQGRVPKRRGLGHLAVYRSLFQASDGWIVLVVLPGQWDNFVRLLTAHDAVDDLGEARFRDADYRVERAEHINKVIDAFACRFDKQYLFVTAQEAGVAVTPVNDTADILADPFLARRGFFRSREQPATGVVLPFAGPPAHFASRLIGCDEGAPALGQDDRATFGEDPTPTVPDMPPHPSLRSAEAMAPREGAWLPLQGVRVLDFTWMIAGPLGTRLLANFGADVIKVESYNRVDRIRETGPHPDGPWSFNEDGSFNDVNLGKRSLLLNLNRPQGPALAKRLAAVSDVVMANFTGDRLDRWGLGFADLVAERPDLIFLNMPVFESDGPSKRWGAIGNHINGLAGINGISGFAGDPPFGLGPLYPDFSGNPYHAMAAILAALIERDRGGGAQFIEVSQYESTVSLLGPALMQQAATGAAPQRTGNRSERACPHNVYPCSGEDHWIAVAIETEPQWRALCATLCRSDWSDDPRFTSPAARRANEDALDALISAQTWQQEAAGLANRLQQAGVPAAPVNHIDDLLADRWYRDEYFIDLEGPEGCVFTTHGEPIRPFGAKHPVQRAPLLGEHTEAVTVDLLGLSAESVDALYTEGALN